MICNYIITNYEPKLKNHVADFTLKNIYSKNYNFFLKSNSGTVVAKINDLASSVPVVVSVFLTCYCRNIFAILVSIYILSTVNIFFGIAVATCSITVFLISFFSAKKFNFLSLKSVEAAAVLIGRIMESIANIFFIKLSASYDHELKIIHSLQSFFLKSSLARRAFIIKLNITQEIGFFIYHSMCVVAALFFLFKNEIAAGDFALVVGINSFIMFTLSSIAENTKQFTENLGAIEQALLSLQLHKIKSKIDNINEVIIRGDIEFENVSFSYDQNVALACLSIAIPDKSKIAIVGVSGSGKSTFVKLIIGIFENYIGNIVISGINIRHISEDELSKKIVFIPQEACIFNSSVRENIAYGAQGIAHEDIIDAAKKANLHGIVMQLQNGYDTIIGERGITLSGGQRQLVSLARAFLKKDATIVIVDEATSNLDGISEDETCETMKKLAMNKTFIMITHNISMIKQFDRIFLFDKGKVVGNDTHSVLLNNNELYKKLNKK
jgi:ATP-binding cassette subfamily B protein